MQHGGGDRVGAHRHAADSVVLEVCGELEHHPADQRRGRTGQGGAPQVEVVVRLKARGQGDPSAHDRLLTDDGQQLLAVGHRPGP